MAGPDTRRQRNEGRVCVRAWRVPIFGDFSGHADGERRGPDRIGGCRWKGVDETRRQVPSGRPRPSAFAVGVLRDACKKGKVCARLACA